MSEKKVEGTELQRYQRTFSDLGQFQKAHSVCYRLYQQEKNCVFVIESRGEATQSTQVTSKIPKEQAMQLMTLLYENAVSIELCRDVLAEFTVGAVAQ